MIIFNYIFPILQSRNSEIIENRRVNLFTFWDFYSRDLARQYDMPLHCAPEVEKCEKSQKTKLLQNYDAF